MDRLVWVTLTILWLLLICYLWQTAGCSATTPC